VKERPHRLFKSSRKEPGPMTTTLDLPSRTGAEAIAPGARRPPRRVGYALIACGLALLPWLFVLATGLPSTTTAPHWSVAWVGLDALEALCLITTGLLTLRRDPRHALVATATAMLLVVDAWFDTTTAAQGSDFLTALAMAVGTELPLAVLCTVLAVRALPRTAP
jgi:hypothetical protein